MKCVKCGTELQTNENFCSNCGTNVLTGEANNTEVKNNKNYLLIGIIVVFILSILVVAWFNTRKKVDAILKTETVVLKDMVFEYDRNLWQTDIGAMDSKISELKYNDSKIKFTYYQDTEGNIESYIDSLIESHQNDNYTILSSSEKKVINNLEWRIVKYQKENEIYLELLYGYDFDIYVLTYTANKSVYDSEVSMFEEIYKTIKYNRPNLYETELDAQNKIIGEWDLGKKGYYVVTQNLIYFYEDSTKDFDKVKSGTYIAKKARCRGVEKGYPTDEFVDCVRLTAKYSIGDYIFRISSGVEYEFIFNTSGTYYINNMSYSDMKGHGSGDAIRVK